MSNYSSANTIKMVSVSLVCSYQSRSTFRTSFDSSNGDVGSISARSTFYSSFVRYNWCWKGLPKKRLNIIIIELISSSFHLIHFVWHFIHAKFHFNIYLFFHLFRSSDHCHHSAEFIKCRILSAAFSCFGHRIFANIELLGLWRNVIKNWTITERTAHDKNRNHWLLQMVLTLWKGFRMENIVCVWWTRLRSDCFFGCVFAGGGVSLVMKMRLPKQPSHKWNKLPLQQ